jgi:hypothetical protein
MDISKISVKKSDRFGITVYFTKGDEPTAHKKEDLEGKNLEDFDSLTMQFRLPNYAISKQIMRDSVDYSTGQALMHFGLFNNAIFTYLADGWDAVSAVEKEVDGKMTTVMEPVEFDFVKLNELRPDIALLFVDLVRDKLKDLGLYDAILFS